MKRPLALLASLAFALGPSSPAFSGERPNYHAGFDPTVALPPVNGAVLAAPRPSARAAMFPLPLSVSSWDRRRAGAEVPMFLRATPPALAPGAAALSPAVSGAGARSEAEAAAKTHLRALASLYRLAPEAVAAAVTRHVHDTGRGGVVVTLGQDVDGIEVFHQRLSILLRRDHALVAMGGNLHPAATSTTTAGDSLFALDAAGALAHALGDHLGLVLKAGSLARRESSDARYQRFDFAPPLASEAAGEAFSQPARVKKVFFPMPDRLVPGYYVELFTAGSTHRPPSALAYVIAAAGGRVLYRADLVAHESHGYRVWAESSGEKRPLDGPLADSTPHPTGMPDGLAPPFAAPALVTMDGFNENPEGEADPWLPKGATETRGNNVDAYTDGAMPDGFSAGDLRASLSAPGTFDRVYDPTLGPDATDDQRMAAVTQLFYTTNWHHDWWYASGFDEASGNAQMDNYGRGGAGDDPIHAEAQDDAGFNNANMMTPEDGYSPRMQMYLWRGETRKLSVLPVGADLASGSADFGPSDFELEGEVVLAKDGNAPANDGCQAVSNAVSGKIALVDRGGCMYQQKVANAEAAGAIGVLIANHLPGSEPFSMGVGEGSAVTIPSLSIRFEDGAAIKAALPNSPVIATLTRVAGPNHDGSLDSGVISHEWGHYLHHRLVHCSVSQCRGESEGWGDFNALLLSVREGDDLEGTFATGNYAASYRSNATYFSDRRYPYSTDLTKNPLTFRHISNGTALPPDVPSANQGIENAEVHATGEVWASMLFEAYVGLVRQSEGPSPRYPFAEARRRMADYVVMGMRLAPAEPTFTEQRDALLAAAAASDEADMLALAKGFAKRGAGSCAESPERSAEDNAGVEESFELAPVAVLGAIRLDDGKVTCDGDGRLDAGERGTITIEVANAGAGALDDATIVVAVAGAAVTLAATKVAVPEISPFGKTQVSFEIEMEREMKEPGVLQLTATLESPSSCAKQGSLTVPLRVNYDETSEISATDTFESETDLWAPGELWSKEIDEGGNRAWHGLDADHQTDTWLESPPFVVSKTEPLVISFEHRHSFDEGNGELRDGGVLEITTTGGKLWKDISIYGDPSYGGEIAGNPVSPLSLREAYVGKNASWPATDQVTVDLGDKLAGKTLALRFRLGSDEKGGEFGWQIDNVKIEGITSTPFPELGANTQSCPPAEVGKPEQPAPKTRSGCSCGVAGDVESSGLVPLVAATLALLRRRRRSSVG